MMNLRLTLVKILWEEKALSTCSLLTSMEAPKLLLGLMRQTPFISDLSGREPCTPPANKRLRRSRIPRTSNIWCKRTSALNDQGTASFRKIRGTTSLKVRRFPCQITKRPWLWARSHLLLQREAYFQPPNILWNTKTCRRVGIYRLYMALDSTSSSPYFRRVLSRNIHQRSFRIFCCFVDRMATTPSWYQKMSSRSWRRCQSSNAPRETIASSSTPRRILIPRIKPKLAIVQRSARRNPVLV